MVFGWLNSETRERRRKVRLDRKLLEARTRRFLISYLAADEIRKLHFYRAVEDITRKCQADLNLPLSDLEDAQIAEATSDAAMKLVLAQQERAQNKDARTSDFMTDACATVAIAYRRAAGIYIMDSDMLELGTAAVHLLTMATSYSNARGQ